MTIKKKKPISFFLTERTNALLGGPMNLSQRQEKIIEIVKRDQPLSGEKIADHLGISHATLRTDLSFLTMAGILEAKPKSWLHLHRCGHRTISVRQNLFCQS